MFLEVLSYIGKICLLGLAYCYFKYYGGLEDKSDVNDDETDRLPSDLEALQGMKKDSTIYQVSKLNHSLRMQLNNSQNQMRSASELNQSNSGISELQEDLPLDVTFQYFNISENRIKHELFMVK